MPESQLDEITKSHILHIWQKKYYGIKNYNGINYKKALKYDVVERVSYQTVKCDTTQNIFKLVKSIKLEPIRDSVYLIQRIDSLKNLLMKEANNDFTDSLKPQVTTVDGLHLWGEYDYDQVVATLGIPQSYSDKISTIEEAYGMRFQEYVYSSGTRFSFSNKHLTDFSILSAKDSMFINGTLKIGDSLSKVFTVLRPGSNDYFYVAGNPADQDLGPSLFVTLPGAGDTYIHFYYISDATIKSIHFTTAFY